MQVRVALLCLLLSPAWAADTGTLRGIVHDPQHRPLPGAQIVVRGSGTDRNVLSDSNGEFQFDNLPMGNYRVVVSAQGFRALEQQVTVTVAKSPVVHLQLELAAISSSVEVSGAHSKLDTQVST